MEKTELQKLCEFALNFTITEMVFNCSHINLNNKHTVQAYSTFIVEDFINDYIEWHKGVNNLDITLEEFDLNWLLTDVSDEYKDYLKHQPLNRQLRVAIIQHVSEYVYYEIYQSVQNKLKNLTSRYTDEEFSGFCD